MTTLFRVHNPHTNIGLWYNSEGVKTDFILSMDNAKSRDLPMDYNPDLKGGWLSACDSLEMMRDWFNVEDIIALQGAGYELTRFDVTEYRMVDGHAVFLSSQVIDTAPLDISMLQS